MPILTPDVLAPIEALTAWLSRPETRQRMQAAVLEAVAETERRIVNDTSLRVPRQKSEREGGFRPWPEAQAVRLDPWLEAYKHQLAGQLQSEVLAASPEVFAGVRNRNMIRETVEASVWPEIEPSLRKRAEDLLLTYAVRGVALAWTSRNLGDGLLLGLPEARPDGWQVPLHRPDTEARFAEVVLDSDGKILSDAEALLAVSQSGA